MGIGQRWKNRFILCNGHISPGTAHMLEIRFVGDSVGYYFAFIPDMNRLTAEVAVNLMFQFYDFCIHLFPP
jgi:hypothetical protein